MIPDLYSMWIDVSFKYQHAYIPREENISDQQFFSASFGQSVPRKAVVLVSDSALEELKKIQTTFAFGLSIIIPHSGSFNQSTFFSNGSYGGFT